MKIDRLNPCYAAFHADAVERLSRLPEALFRTVWMGEYHQHIAYEILGRVLNKDELEQYDPCDRHDETMLGRVGMDRLALLAPRWTRGWEDRNRAILRLRLDAPCWPLIVALSLLHTGGQLTGLTVEERQQVVAHEAVETLSRALRRTSNPALCQSDIVREDKFWTRPETAHLRPVILQEFLVATTRDFLLIVRRPDRCFGVTTVAGVRALWRNQREARQLAVMPDFALGATFGGGAGIQQAEVMKEWEADVWREFLAQEVVDTPSWLQKAFQLAADRLAVIPVEQWVVHRVGAESQSRKENKP